MPEVFSFYKGKRILITGHTGFKGAWLSQWLTMLGAKVAGFSLPPITQPNLFDALNLAGEMEDHRGDINDLNQITQVTKNFNPEIIFHLAAQSLVRPGYSNPVQTFKTNTLGTAHILEAARSSSNLKSAIMITTDKVYEPNAHGTPHSESDRLGGHDPYSASKSAAEIVVQSFSKSFFTASNAPVISSVRAGNVIGGGDWSEDRLIPDAVKAWNTKKSLVIRSPNSVRPWQHVLEPLSGYLSLGMATIEKPENFRGKSYNFGPLSEDGATVQEVLSFFRSRWLGFNWSVDPSTTGDKKETHLLRLSWKNAEKDLSWKPRLDLTNTLEWTSSWYEGFYQDSHSAKTSTLKQIQNYQELLK